MCRLLVALMAGAVIISGASPETPEKRRPAWPDGDVARGKTAYVKFQCHACHEISGLKLPPPTKGTDMAIQLGGKVRPPQVATELVSSIVDPSHQIAEGRVREEITKDAAGKESRMVNYNSVMTVQELIDLVAFLKSHYKLELKQPAEQVRKQHARTVLTREKLL